MRWGIRLSVIVTPAAKAERVERLDDTQLRVAVAEPPREGRANAAVVSAVARFLGVPVSHVRIVRGLTSRRKVVEVR